MNRPAEGTADSWGSTTTLADVAKWLGASRRALVLTHHKPDGDAAGSTLALARTLRRVKGSDDAASIWYWGPLPLFLPHLAADTGYLHLDGRAIPPTEPDAIVILDTGSWSQLEPVKGWLAARTGRIAVIDHHLQGDPGVTARRVVTPTAAAACELVAELCANLLSRPGPAALPVEIATPLYAGIATDTGWFRHSNVTAATMKLASQLLEAGADHTGIYSAIEQHERPARLSIMARALASVEYHDRGRLALMTLTQRDFADCGAENVDSGGFADAPLIIESVRVAAVLTEMPADGGQPPITKLSVRSKVGPDSLDVNALSKTLGGGGHARAAGARINAPLAEARRRLLASVAAARSGEAA